VAGHRLGVNPFDQPNVEAAKRIARKAVAEYKKKGSLPMETPTLIKDGIEVYGKTAAAQPAEALKAFVAQAKPGSYVALQAFLEPTAEIDAALQALRMSLGRWSRLATTRGYGPRFLHSTGQLHKGDAGKGFFIQLTADDARDAPIPDEAGSSASSSTFGMLKAAQALGDRRALAAAARKVLRLHLGKDPVKGLKRLHVTIT